MHSSLVRTAYGQLWRQFAHPNQPHPGVNGAITTPELFANQNTVVERPLLVVLMEFTDVQHQAAHDVAHFDDLFFGQNRANGRPSVAEIYRENSNGRLLLVPATDGDLDGTKDGIIGWRTTQATYGDYCCDLIEIQQKRAEAIRIADPLFDYAIYDMPPRGNGDSVITKDELAVILVNAAASGGANVRATNPSPVPVEGNKLNVSQAIAAATEHEHVGTMAHELGHQILGLGDLYEATPNTHVADGYLVNNNTDWLPPPPGPYSFMALYPEWRILHLDPWAKIHLGFVKPLIVTHDGTYTLYDAETERTFPLQDSQPEAIIIYDPLQNDPYKEYFILENRNQEALDDQGLAVWLVNENETNLRKVIRLIRREGHWPTTWHNDSLALWNGIDKVQGYDFTATSTPRNTGWTNATASYIEIYDISPAGPTMTFKVRMPPIFVDQANNGFEYGSQSNPFNTVIEGINAIIEPPRTIRIAGGFYPEKLIINTLVTLKGWRNGNAVIGN
ncbi:MAG: hypothetical protein ACE5HS_18135 [bacterium]